MRSFGVLRSPVVVFGVTMNDVPAEIIYRYDLRWQVWFLPLWPNDLPLIVVIHYFEVPALMQSAHRGSPGQVGAHNRLIAVSCNYSGFKLLQVRVGFETPI